MSNNKFFLTLFALVSSFFLFTGCDTGLTSNPISPATQWTLSTAMGGREEIISGFNSNILKNSRSLRIYLPKGYASSTESYPVLYMHDGQNIFAPGGTYGCWNLETIVDSLTDAGTIVPVIVVGIDSLDASRAAEYNLGANGNTQGIVEDYAQFVITEVMPFINTQYRTKTGPENTAIMGSSFGGNASLYFAWNHSDIFGMAGCVSSALWWNDFAFLNSIKASTATKKPVKLWIDSGDAEDADENGDGVDLFGEMAFDLTNSLLKQGWIYNTDLLFEVAKGAIHNEAAWSARVAKPLQFFFQKPLSFTPVSIESRSSSLGLDIDGNIPQSILFTKVTYSNGIIADLPPSLYTVTSNNDNYFTLKDGVITLNKVNIPGPTTLDLVVTYQGLTSNLSIPIVQTIDTSVTVDLTITAPMNSPATIYMVGNFCGWNPPSGFKISLAETTATGKIYRLKLTGVPRGTNISFKFCSGPAWSYEELNGTGGPITDRSIKATGDTNPYSATVLQWKAVP